MPPQLPLKKDHESADDRAQACQWKRCSRPAEIVYLGDGLCGRHWVEACDMIEEEQEP